MKMGVTYELRNEQHEIIFATDFYLYISNQMINWKFIVPPQSHATSVFLNLKFSDLFLFIVSLSLIIA